MKEAHGVFLSEKFRRTLSKEGVSVSVFHSTGKKLPPWDGGKIIVNSGSKDWGPPPNASARRM